MQILGIDYGRKKIGLALSSGRLAEPHKVLRLNMAEEGAAKVCEIIDEVGVEKIVIGISEGEMAEEARAFGDKVEHLCKKPVIFQDETLSTKDAQRLSLEAGIKRKKRKSMEDAYSAALILQAYLDTK
jgi:putative Holliday junction resolvase